MPPTEFERVQHILDAIEKIDRWVADLDESSFEADEKVQSAILYQLATIGEAAGKLGGELKARHPDVPWDQIRGFRNRVMHEYHGVSTRIVWRTLEAQLPDLKAAMLHEYASLKRIASRRKHT